MATSESSVMMALSELQKIEHERVESAQRAEAARRDDEARRAREAAAAAAKQAELERIRVEAEARARVEVAASRDRSLDDLRARIASVQAERAALHDELRARIERAGEPAARRSPWALAFGASSLVAAALAGMLVMHAQRPREIVRTIEVPVIAPAVEVAALEPAVEPAAPEPAPVVVAETHRPSSPRLRPARPRPHVTTDPTTRRDSLADALGLDDEDDDVLGGIHGARH